MKNIEWFKNEFEYYLKEFEIEYRCFEKGDFGRLNQVEFNSQKKGGEIDFWNSGRLSIFFVDYETGNILLNELVIPEQDPNHEQKKEIAFQKLKELL